MIKVKLTVSADFPASKNSPSSKERILKQTPGLSGKWGDFQFYVNEEVAECDYLVVLEDIPKKKDSTNCPWENTIFITGDASTGKGYNQKFLNQFSTIITSHRRIRHPNIYHMPQGDTWFPYKHYDELFGNDNVEKSKLISIVVSNKSGTPVHKKRLEFCLALKEHFGDRIDLFGRGIREFDDKWDVVAPYKYSIAIENNVELDFISEKIEDCFISLTFPFYYGCPNIDTYYDKDSYQLIDIDDFKGSCDTIEKVINDETHYDQHLESLIGSKNKYLNHYSLIPLIADFIQNNYGKTVNSHRERITFKSRRELQKSFATVWYDVKRALKQKMIAYHLC